MAPRTVLPALLLVACLTGCTISAGTPTPTPSTTAGAAPSASAGSATPSTPGSSSPASPGRSASPSRSATPAEVPALPGSTPGPSAGDPAPTSSRPDFADLVVRPDGVGAIVIGESAAASGMLVHDPDYCTVDGDPTAYGYAAGDPAAGRWLADYPEQSEPFTVGVDDDDRVVAVGIRSAELATAAGIRLGSTREELFAAYPALEQTDVGAFSTVYLLSEPGGLLVFEVLDADYDPTVQTGTVVLLSAHDPALGSPTARYATDASIGGCL